MKLITAFQSALIKVFIVVLPLFFLPLTIDAFEFNKLALLVIVSILGFLLWAVGKIKDRSFLDFFVGLRVTVFDLPILLLATVFAVSTFVESGNKLSALAFPGTASLVIAGSLFYFVLVQYLGDREGEGFQGRIEAVVWSIIVGAAALSVFGIVTFLLFGTGAGSSLAWPSFLPKTLFSPLGSIAGTVFFLLPVLPLAIGKVVQALNKPSDKEVNYLAIVGSVVSLFVLIVGTGIFAFHILPGKIAEYKVLPVNFGWEAAIEAIKREPLFGVGPGDFPEIFTRSRSVAFNQTAFWNTGFIFSTNTYLEFITATGLLGLVGLIWFLWSARKVIFGQKAKIPDGPFIKVAFVLCLIVLLFVPPIVPIITLFFILAALLGSMESRGIRLEFSILGVDTKRLSQEEFPKANLVALVFVGISVLLLGFVVWFGGRVYAAEVKYRQAQEAILSQAKYKDIMDTLASAITLNPYMERYRMDYSQIALALVREIVKKQELSDADRQDITTLVQVAIGEAKAAVAINSTSSVTWANLARVYQAIMPIVQGADSWAIASFQQAINLDPVNPILRLGLGGVYYSLSRWDQAIRSFELAVAAKPDLANAHYNLALALREAGKLEEAADSMRQTIALLNAGTPDYDKAKKELEDLEAKIKTKKESEKAKKETGSEQAPAVTPGQGEQPPLEKPTVQKEPIVKPPINLPQGSEPPKQ